MGRTVLLVTGEPSGDLAGARLVRALRARDPGLRFLAVGGEKLRAEGAELLADIADLGAMGFAEVVRQIPRLADLERRLVERLAAGGVDVVVPVDYPGFNLRFAANAKRRGLPVVYYIAPQAWAWGRGRLKRIARVVDRLLVVLPFEERFFRDVGIDAAFVGHPLLEGIDEVPDRAAARASLGLEPDRPVLGLLPGSRVQEIRRSLPAMRGAARLLRDRVPELVTLVSRASSIPPPELRETSAPSERVVAGDAARVITASDVLFVTSGTATLEAALLGTPLAVVYKTSSITWSIGRALVRLPRIGLVNIVAGEELAPEFLQEGARPEALAAFAASLFANPGERRRRAAALRGLRDRFAGLPASERAAAVVLETLERRTS